MANSLTLAAGAAALVASHRMAEKLWRAYFPEIPPDEPEHRTLLLETHIRAFKGNPANKTEAYKLLTDQFGHSANTARSRVTWLIENGFLIEMDGDKRSEDHLIPSNQAKAGLNNIGHEFLVCLWQASDKLHRQIEEIVEMSQSTNDEVEWLSDVQDVLSAAVQDYETKKAKTN